MATGIEPVLTVADLDAFPEDDNRYELIDGVLSVSGAPFVSHQLALQSLQMTLVKYLEAKPIGMGVPSVEAVFSEYDKVIPDLVFVREERWDKIVANERFVGAPDLVIEVLSPGPENRQRDLSVKRQLYAKYRVEEYWVVDVENRSVLIHRLVGQTLEEVEIVKDHAMVTSPILPGFQLHIGSIFSI